MRRLLILLWIYLMGQNVVIGAEITALRAGRRGDGAGPDAHEELDAVAHNEKGVQP